MMAAKTTILVVLPMGTSSTTIVKILVVMRTTIVTMDGSNTDNKESKARNSHW